MKAIKIIAIVSVVLYVLTCTGLYLSQDMLIFDPDKLPENYVFRSGIEVEVPTHDEVSINSIHIKTPNPKGVILYLHGNRGSNRRCLRQAEMLEGFGYDIFMPDYRGYGKTEGAISSQKQLFKDVQAVYDHLLTQYDESQIHLFGYSLGTGLATYLAANNNPAQLFLVAPYVSFVDLKDRRFPLIPDFLIKYPLNNKSHLENVNCPVTLLHGTHDEIIPFDSSEVLVNVNPSKIKLVPLVATSHRRAIFHNAIRDTLRRAL